METLISSATQEVVKLGVVFTMFLVITYILCKAVKILYDRNQALGDAFLKAITDHTAATNNLANKIESMGDGNVRKA